MSVMVIIYILIYNSFLFVDGIRQIEEGNETIATCELSDPTGMHNVTGRLTLSQPQSSFFVTVKGKIYGLKFGLHGFHVHRDGGVGKNCSNSGPHFNPFNETHGAPFDRTRHVGDLGNIFSDPYDTAYVEIVDNEIKLRNRTEKNLSIIGRSIVVHANQDDLGRGHNKESLITGNAGRRLACCQINLKHV